MCVCVPRFRLCARAQNTTIERKPLRFTYSRLNSLLRTLEVTNLDDFRPLSVSQPAMLAFAALAVRE
jgi:hypothetical protein